MPCLYPITAYKSRERAPGTGRYGITFNANQALIEGSTFTVPCQKCQGCRVDRSRDWAVRCTHEAKMHQDNCFLTLTYNDDQLPVDYSVDPLVLKNFIKRLREHADPIKIRFFAAGEYGDKNFRPHYHLLIFNYDFSDKIIHSKKNNITLYTSKQLTSLWPYGFSTTGSANYQTAAYCARYTLKKIGGDEAADYYTRQHPLTGIFHTVLPEFSRQSRMPGLGASFFHKYKSDIFPSDFLIVDRKKHPVPKYYFKLLAEEEQRLIKRKRGASSPTKGDKPSTIERRWNNTPARLRVREEVFAAKINKLKRDL